MSNAKPTKTEIKSTNLRVAALRAELSDPYTQRLGVAAVHCVQQTLDAVLGGAMARGIEVTG